MRATAGSGPVIRELEVPPQVLRRLAARSPERYPILLDSAADGPLSRASILFAEPRAALWLDCDGRLGADGTTVQGPDFLTALENWWLAERDVGSAGAAVHSDTAARGGTAPPHHPGFNGGWAVFLSYEMAREIEPKLLLPRAKLPWQAFALRAPCALIHERASGRVYAIAEPECAAALDRIEADARQAAAGQAEPLNDLLRVEAVFEEEPAKYLHRVARAKEYVRAGDIYQANLSRPWRVQFAGEPDIAALYNRLCRANPAPFAALAQWRGARILSSSPERLLRVQGRHVDTRPIAGTRPRSLRPGVDLVEMKELAAHPKERAEHIMLIDLERNDLGRVCRAGTVRVDELMTIESYAHVHHIVSNVTGELRADVTPIGALRAVFPGGTITGCPKFRCMQIIAELEGTGRGAYTGSLGFLGRDGTMDMNILIRTMTVSEGSVELRAGGGIVADSDPQRELEETRAKARGMLAAFDISQAAGAVA
ncbi:MAG TPA: aminodeoxychorismate synthase component I [Steroidobacteraceae bacterium]|nr:aminodeoxychorismate synthase component I [Steroidobacteraceae bacterium]